MKIFILIIVMLSASGCANLRGFGRGLSQTMAAQRRQSPDYTCRTLMNGNQAYTSCTEY